MKGFKPLLAVDFGSVENIKFPVLASPKLDGIRATVVPGQGLLSRSLKPIPNDYTRKLFSIPALEGVDGELIVGSAVGERVFNRTTSGIMSKAGEPDVTFCVFDTLAPGPDIPFHQRLEHLRAQTAYLPKVTVVLHQTIRSASELETFELAMLDEGFEGAMARDPNGRYKYGRSTLREGILLKVKRFDDLEAEVIGVEELMTNENEQVRDERGYAKRSTAKAGLVPTGTLGALICKAPQFAHEFNVGSGFTAAQRAELWRQREALVGELAVVKYQAVGSSTDRPRLPIWKGWRSPLDL